MKKTSFILAFVLFCCVSVYSQNKNYGASDNEISVAVGEQFTITMSSNKTTGYSWSVGMITDKSQVVVTGVEYKVPDDVKTGQGGEEVWYFKAVAPGTAKIMMYYARPWENDKPVKENTFEVLIK